MVVGMQQGASFDAKCLGNPQHLVRYAGIEAEKEIQLVRREEVPVLHVAPKVLLIGMVCN